MYEYTYSNKRVPHKQLEHLQEQSSVPCSSFLELLVGLYREAQIGLGFQFGLAFHYWISPLHQLSSTGQYERKKKEVRGKQISSRHSIKGGKQNVESFWGRRFEVLAPEFKDAHSL